MKQYKNILFAPDGEYVTDNASDTIDGVWSHHNDMGSRWFYYPFAFVVRGTSPRSRIVSSPDFPLLRNMNGKTVRTVQRFIRDNADQLCDILNA